MIRTVDSKTSWAADGFDHDHGGKRATTVRRGEADDGGAPVVIKATLGPNIEVALHSPHAGLFG